MRHRRMTAAVILGSLATFFVGGCEGSTEAEDGTASAPLLGLPATFPILGTPACVPPSAPSDPGGFLNVLAPAQGGSTTSASVLANGGAVASANSADQVAMYDGLRRGYPTLTDATLGSYFKTASFGATVAVRSYSPRPGVCIVRDNFGVPHVYGQTAADVSFGAGYVTAEDRMFFADVLRHVGKGRMSELLGPTPENIAADRAMIQVAGYTEAELQTMLDRLGTLGSAGQLAKASFIAQADGYNQFLNEALLDTTKLPVEYAALQIAPEPWKALDSAAVAIPVQVLFASGGGSEHVNADLLQRLRLKLGARGDLAFHDLLVREDPEAQVTTQRRFDYNAGGVVDPSKVAIPDADSFVAQNPITTLRERLRAIGLNLPSGMSNFLGVKADRASGGRPIAVMGPQTGYYTPEILFELDLHGGGIDARGVAFPGVSAFILMGRGTNYAWSATSGYSDLADVRVEKLCNSQGGPVSAAATEYLFNGTCTPMYKRTDSWLSKPTAPSITAGYALPEVITAQIERTVHGPVIGRATVKGQPVALTYQRSTFMGELDSAVGFVQFGLNQIATPEQFYDVANSVTGSFSFMWVSRTDLAYFHSGLYPRRAPGIDPELPSWGTGNAEWQGVLSRDEHPHEANPPKGFFVNWNGKPAPGWRASDSNYSYQNIQRGVSLMDRVAPLAARGEVTQSDMVKAMEDAATVDLRGSKVLPTALTLLDGRPEVAQYRTLLASWVANGAHRIDRDGNGAYDEEAAIALLDAWYERMIHGAFDDKVGDLYAKIPLPFDDNARLLHQGTSFQMGWYHTLEKSFRQALGVAVAEPMDVLVCADGIREGCAAMLSRTLLDAAAALTTQYGTVWKAPKSGDELRFTSTGVATLPAIDWQNRPTFQQVVQVK